MIKDGWYYVAVFALLVFMLLFLKREAHAPFYATALLLVLVARRLGAGRAVAWWSGMGYGLCTFAWPQARYCVMGAEQAAGTITDVRAAAAKRKGKSIDEEELQAFFTEVRDKYERETDPLYAASRLWIDAIIDPRETRRFLSLALEASANKTELDPFRTGVFQT